jgi:multidrug efflux pump subunit AcrA (membrane-fusion protein)
MTSAEQQALAQARARIEHNLAEISALARDGRLPPAFFFGRFLALALESLDAMGGAVWSAEDSNTERVADLAFGSAGYDDPRQKVWIEKVLGHVLATGKPCIVAVQDQAPDGGSDAVGNSVPHPFFYTPVALGGRVRMILQIWLKQAGDPRSYSDIAAFLGGLAQQAATYLLGAEQVALRQEQARHRQMLSMQEAMLGELEPKILMTVAANYLVDLLPCALGAVLQRKGAKWQLVAASNQETVDAAADQSRALARLASVLPESLEPKVCPAEGDPAPEDLTRALEAAGYRGMAWCHLRPSKNAPHSAVILACWHDEPTNPTASVGTMTWLTAQLARSLDAATHFHHMPFRHATSAAGRVLRAWQHGRRRRVFAWVIAPVLVLLGALLFPVPYKIKADCAVVPAQTATVVAETEGKIVDVAVAEGESVSAGQLLARLEDTDYATQLAASQQQLSRHRVEAARAQALGNEPERKIAELASRREEHNIRRLEYLRARTELRSPIEGVVLTRGIQQRAGEAMEKGKVLCEVGSSGAYELQLDLRQQDLGPLLRALSEGRPLPVDFILHADARQTLRGEFSGALQVSQLPVPRANQTVFLARLPFPDGAPDGGVKAGYTGKASVSLGRRPWGLVLVQPFLQYWRMNWSL